MEKNIDCNSIIEEIERTNQKGDKFTHLHVHDYYSMLDGFGSPSSNAKRAKELGMTHLAQTNHNHLGGVIEFQEACKNEGIMPILGYEGYWTKDTKVLSSSSTNRNKLAKDAAIADGVEIPEKAIKKEIDLLTEKYKYDTKQYHILFLAKNQNGWKNVIKLQSIGSEKCTFNGRYLVDNNIMEEYSEDVICSNACIGSYSARMINEGNIEEAEKHVEDLHRIFKENFYLEIQPLNLDQQHKVNLQYIKWGKEKGIKLIVTNDVHYTMKEDHKDHDTLMCIGMGKSKADTSRMQYSNDYWLRSYDEMMKAFETQEKSMNMEMSRKEYFEEIEKAMANTMEIANQIEDIELGSDIDLFANMEIESKLKAEEDIVLKCHKGLYKYKNKFPDIDIVEYEKRLDQELTVINGKGFAPYFLIVLDYIEWANKNGVPTGPSRG